MSHRTTSCDPFAACVAALLLATALAGCGPARLAEDFDALKLCVDDGDDLAYAGLDAEPPAVVLNDPGAITVLHGSARASHHTGALIRVRQRVDVPTSFNRATVFLNGWRLRFLDGDRHVRDLATAIVRIRVERGVVRWEALAGLRENNSDEPFEWEYRYTVVAWNANRVRAEVDHNDIEQFCQTEQASGADNAYYASNDTSRSGTALASFRSFLENPAWTAGGRVAVLPRGFGFAWREDGHLLQLGYNLESTEGYVWDRGLYNKVDDRIQPVPGGTGDDGLDSGPATARSGFVSWKTDAIFKENDAGHSYGFAEVVSGIGGPDVDVMQPPFALVPRAKSGNAVGQGPLPAAESVVRDLPYDYAIPMLTGWELCYGGSDKHVRELGIWLDGFDYAPPAGTQSGTLRYRVGAVLRDGGSPPWSYRHKVTILGLRRAPATGAGTTQPAPPTTLPTTWPTDAAAAASSAATETRPAGGTAGQR